MKARSQGNKKRKETATRGRQRANHTGYGKRTGQVVGEKTTRIDYVYQTKDRSRLDAEKKDICLRGLAT